LTFIPTSPGASLNFLSEKHPNYQLEKNFEIRGRISKECGVGGYVY